MKMRKLSAAVLCALLLAGCGQSEDAIAETAEDEYIAVYREIEQTQSRSEEELLQTDVPAVLPSAYTYSYLDNIMFVGDEMCGEMLNHGLLEDSQVISAAGAEAGGLLEAKAEVPGEAKSSDDGTPTEQRQVSDLLRENSKPYIYLWTGMTELTEGEEPEDYGEAAAETAARIREICPDSMVILLGPAPQAEITGMSDRIAGYNDALHAAVKSYPDQYMIYMDISGALAGADGCLNTAYDKGDGVTLNRAGCRKLLSTIEGDRFYSGLCGDEKYRYMYKDIYASREPYTVTEGKIAYLTFDDGPSKHTPEILAILKENDIKATFFITGWCIDGKEDTLAQIAAEGHTIALHSYTHDYEEIYASVDAFLEDFAKVYNRVYDVTGKKPWAFRFPGGSYNSFNKETADDIIAEMKRRGFAYYDWNAATSDATTSATYDSCIENLIDSVYSDHSVVLMHDSLELTPQYLQDVIDYLKSEDYSFETIDTADEVQF